MTLALIHFIATAYMTGLIWFVQLVHYPLMAAVGPDRFAAYERAHQQRTSIAVGPAMLIEMITAIALVVRPPTDTPPWLPGLGLAMLIVIWLSTAFLQVPAHRQLEVGFDEAAHRRLVRTNWLRTALWTTRTATAVIVLRPPA